MASVFARYIIKQYSEGQKGTMLQTFFSGETEGQCSPAKGFVVLPL